MVELSLERLSLLQVTLDQNPVSVNLIFMQLASQNNNLLCFNVQWGLCQVTIL